MEFYRQMEHLRRNYNIVPIEDIVEFAAGKRRLPEKAVAITFDDGYGDNYSRVYPYLKSHGLPATIFICTGYVGRQLLLGGYYLNMLNWNQIVEMSRNNATVGAHTETHSDLCKEAHERARENIKISKEEIERRTGKPVKYFSYPFYRFDHETIELVRLLGFEGAFGGSSGVVRQGDLTLALNRIQVDRSVSFLMFRARMTRAGLRYIEARRRLRASRRFRFMSAVYAKCEAIVRIHGGT
jgi:peptidoglycan/xylan/chitin deacetylase (PgdA/CDA1 family)